MINGGLTFNHSPDPLPVLHVTSQPQFTGVLGAPGQTVPLHDVELVSIRNVRVRHFAVYYVALRGDTAASQNLQGQLVKTQGFVSL